jgi:hypothetical protein
VAFEKLFKLQNQINLMASKVVPDVSDDVELYKIEHQDDIESPMFVELTPMKDAVPYGRISPIDIITAKEKKSAQVVPYNGDNVKFYQVTQQDENENDSPIPMDSTPEDEAKNERISPIGFASEITPPRKEKKKPKIVSISVKIYSISDINCIEVTFQVSIKLFLRWEDPKLIGHKVGRVKPGIEPGEYEIPGLFNPDIQIANEFELHETSRDLRVIDSKTGKVKLSVSYRGKLFMMEMGLKYFPFDAQNLQIILKPHKLDETNVILKYSPDESASDFHPVHEWRFVGFCAKHYRTDPNTSTVGKIYSSLHVVICVQRESGWFVNNILIPTFILTMVSWATFGLYPTGEYAVRMDSAVGTILATVANKFVVADSLPKVPYRSLVDIYLDVSFLCQVIAVFATILVSMYATPYNYVHEIEEVEGLLSFEICCNPH